MRLFLTICLFVSISFLSNTLSAQSLHAVLVGDTNDPVSGEARKQDLKHLMTFLNYVTSALGYDLKSQIVQPEKSWLLGTEYNVPEITSLIISLDIKEDDIFFFYFSGHGTKSFDEDDPFAVPHIVNYKYKYLSLQTVQKLAQINEPRLSIVMGNLCNGSDDEVKYQSKYQTWKKPPELTKTIKQNLSVLFSKSGKITATSSKRGKYSYSQVDGGVFTKCILDAFYSEVEQSGPVVWEHLLSKAKDLSQEGIEVVPYYEIDI